MLSDLLNPMQKRAGFPVPGPWTAILIAAMMLFYTFLAALLQLRGH